MIDVSIGPEDKLSLFSELEIGAIFRHNSEVYIKTGSSRSSNNAIWLSCGDYFGCPCHYNPGDKVVFCPNVEIKVRG